MQDGQGKRDLAEAVDELADNVGALVAKEQAGQHLDLEIGPQLDIAQAPGHGVRHISSITRQVFKLAGQAKVIHQRDQRLVHAGACRVISAVSWLCGGFLVLDVFGADSRPDKDEIVLKVTAVQDFGGDGIEKGFGQFGLVVVDQQPDVMQLDLMPDIHRLLAGLELALQPDRRFAHPQVVELDALALGALLAVPVGGFKAVLGTA